MPYEISFDKDLLNIELKLNMFFAFLKILMVSKLFLVII